MEFEQLTESVIGCAFEVFNHLGGGFMESVYEKSLLYELKSRGIGAESQVSMRVQYKGIEVGYFVADLIVEEVLIVEVKAVRTLDTIHEVQLVNYLNAIHKPVGLLINFGDKKVDVRRKVRVLDVRQ